MVTTDTPISVIRRVGGLEVTMDSIGCDAEVIRRVGGLEATHRAHHAQAMVIRRVGGLEAYLPCSGSSALLSAV